MSSTRSLTLLVILLVASAQAAPFFDALYDALNGNTRRSYGYSGYGNSGYNYNYNYNHREPERPRAGKSYKEICRAHYPDSIANPAAGGVVCPY